MPTITFHHGAQDRLATACLLVRDGFREGRRVLVYAPEPQLAARFDTQLWTFSALDFVPHCREGSALAPETPVLIAGSLADHDDVLLNLADEVPPGFERFREVIEIVSLDDAGPARQRFRAYRERGFTPEARPCAA